MQFSTNGTDWTDLSDNATVEIPPDLGVRPTTSLRPYGYDVDIIIPGRRPAMVLVITYDYQDAARDNTIRQAWEAHTPFYIRWAPRGNLSGNFLFTSDAGYILSPPLPNAEAHTAAVTLDRFTFTCAQFTQSTIGIT